MKYKIIFLFILPVILLSGQKKTNDSLLVGSWRFQGYQFSGDPVPSSLQNSIISFYKDSVFQRVNVFYQADSVIYFGRNALVSAGKWKLLENNTTISFSSMHDVSFEPGEDSPDYIVGIKSVDDTSLILVGEERDKPAYAYYKRTKNAPVQKDGYKQNTMWENQSTGTENISGSIILKKNDRYDYYLVNSIDSSRRKKVIPGSVLDIYYTLPITDSSVSRKTTSLKGEFISVDDTGVKFFLNSERVTVYKKNGSYNTYSKYSTNKFEEDSEEHYDLYGQPSNYVLQKREVRSIDLLRVTSIRYDKDTDGANTFGGVICFMSAASALIVAPLVSINFKNGAFNSYRYYRWAGFSLAGFTVGIPLVAYGKSRHYNLRNKNQAPYEGGWKLVQKPK